MKVIKTIFGEVYPSISDNLNKLIGGNKDFNIIGDTKDGMKLLELVREKNPDLVIMSKDLVSSMNKNRTGLDYCKMITGEFPQCVVIVTSLNEEPDDIRNTMQAGARDFISDTDIPKRLLKSIYTLMEIMENTSNKEGQKRGKVLTYISAKGGAGKTTLSYNTSAEIIRLLKMSDETARVLLIDYDLQFGDISYISSIKPKRTISDLNDLEDIDQDALEAHLEYHKKGDFYVLAAPLKPHFADQIRPEIIEKIIKVAKRNFDFVIVDSMQGFNKASILAIDQSDCTIVVSNGQLVGLKNAKITLDTLSELLLNEFDDLDEKELKKRMKLVINNHDKNSFPMEDIARKFGKYDLLGSIPKDDRTVITAVNNNQFVVTDYQNTPIAKAIKELVKKIMVDVGLEITENNGKGKNRPKGSMAMKLFGK